MKIKIYEMCKSWELITSFNWSGLWVKYRKTEKHREDLAKLAISKNAVPLPMDFSKVNFTLAAFDSYNHNGKSTTSVT